MSVTIDVPEKVLAEALHVPVADVPKHIRIELACALYSQGRLSLAQAAELSDMSRLEFAEQLGSRNIPRHYTAEDLATDEQYARGE